MTARSQFVKLRIMAGFAVLAFAIGFVLQQWIPMIKQLCTPSFIFYSVGWVLLMLIGFCWLIEVRGWRKPAFPLVVVGMNSIFIYSLSELLHSWLDRAVGVFTFKFRFFGTLAPVARRCGWRNQRVHECCTPCSRRWNTQRSRDISRAISLSSRLSFNEHWGQHSKVFAHFARNYKTGEAMPVALVTKLRDAEKFNQGYSITELLAAAELDMQWHLLPAGAPIKNPDTFEQAALERKKIDLPAVPPRYRSSYFGHIWDSGYAAGYYAYLWSQMIDNDAYSWFTEHGGLTRANGDRFRRMVLSRGSSEDFETAYEAWRGGPPTIDALVKHWGLVMTR